MYSITTATKKIAAFKKRIRVVQGGTSASKTISILLILIKMCQEDTKPTLTSIVSESLPHLKLGAMRDFLDILKTHNYYQEDRWNRTDFIYTFESGSKIEFFGADAPAKAHGPRRNRLFVNEANNVPYASFDQMEVRTSGTVFIDYNPTSEFWYHTEVMNQRSEDVDFIILTYKDNEALPSSIVKSIESRMGNRSWWKVYGEGQIGDFEGKIYRDWDVSIDEIPHEARLERYGLDFGYTNDPTAIVALYKYNGGYILDEIAYQKGLSNREISDILSNEQKALVKGDSAEPKSIDEIRSYGILIQPCTKGRDSVVQGIQYVQDQRISVTKRSLNLIKEYRNYMWQTDRDGRSLNVPIDSYNHALDAVRYALEGATRTIIDTLEVVGYERGLGGIEIPVYNI